MTTTHPQFADGTLPANVVLGPDTLVGGAQTFKRFQAQSDRALVIGSHCTMDGVLFAAGQHGRISIGDFCYFTNAVILCEQEICIGNYVVIGWNATIADSDYHPAAPAERIADAIALSPLGAGRPRPIFPKAPVIIEDDVWIGPMAAILKGVRIGQGSVIEAGAVVTRDVPARSRVAGNPARIVGQV